MDFFRNKYIYNHEQSGVKNIDNKRNASIVLGVTDLDGTLTVKGLLAAWVDLKLINMTTLEKVDAILSDGMYLVIGSEASEVVQLSLSSSTDATVVAEFLI